MDTPALLLSVRAPEGGLGHDAGRFPDGREGGDALGMERLPRAGRSFTAFFLVNQSVRGATLEGPEETGSLVNFLGDPWRPVPW